LEIRMLMQEYIFFLLSFLLHKFGELN